MRRGRPSAFLRGFASIFDVSGQAGRRQALDDVDDLLGRRRRRHLGGPEADWEALNADGLAVARDLERARRRLGGS